MLEAPSICFWLLWSSPGFMHAVCMCQCVRYVYVGVVFTLTRGVKCMQDAAFHVDTCEHMNRSLVCSWLNPVEFCNVLSRKLKF